MSTPHTNSTTGVIAREEQAAIDAIKAALASEGIEPGNKPIDLRPLPFDGTWGSASTIARMAAGDIAQKQLDADGALEGLSKKESKKLVNERVGTVSQDLAEKLAAHVLASGRFASVEAVNGYINIGYDADATTNRLVSEVLSQADTYGHAAPDTGIKVMIEHSQLNTHKAAHVGHLRNICLGVALTNISTAAGNTTTPVTYIGDIGRHVIKCLWAYKSFHTGEEPPADISRGRWLGEIYVEAGMRLNYRKDVISFLNDLIKNDDGLGDAVDRMLKDLWNNDEPIDGEDIAYLLGKVTTNGEINPDELIDASVIQEFFPLLGPYLQQTAEEATEPEDAATAAAERYAEWQSLNATIDWWNQVPGWIEVEKKTFQLWEDQDPEFVKLWEVTRDWSMDELKEIFTEFGAEFDTWFTESEVEDEGRVMVRELLERGVAEISDGLPVVKIDEKLGLEHETYRTMPILRSDGSTLYSTKDLALARKKFQNFDIDQSIWVVDVRQSLYFDQITRILELYGFDDADANLHLGYEFVTLPSGIMSSRKGNAPLLEDVRNAMISRALDVVKEKNQGLSPEQQEQAAHDIAIGAIKYAMLARDGNKVIVFDPEEALSFEGHAAPYIQYAHARACRILERAGVADSDIAGNLAKTSFKDQIPSELSLLQQISAFPEIVQRAAAEHRPLHLTNYVFELAKRFNDFYHEAPVLQEGIEPAMKQARLALVTATRITLHNGLALLGIVAPEQM